MRISSDFEAGSINVVSCDNPDAVILELRPDCKADFYQWFFFRVTGARGENLRLIFANAHLSNAAKGLVGMPDPWVDYEVMASYDLENWFRIPTRYDGTRLEATVTPAADSLYFANFPPYSLERLRKLVGRAVLSPRVALDVLGQTPDGHDLEVLRIGQPGPAKKVCWVTTRQHPAEIQGSWCVEGIIDRLLDEADPVVGALLDRAVFYVVPNMNPDGSCRGHTRTNALGANLNREWVNPSMEFAPETFMVKRAMERAGLDFCLDVHAWAGTHNYAVGPYHTPSVTPRQTELWKRYEAALAIDPHFEVGWPYPGGGPKPGEADLSMVWNYFSETRGAIGVLYELMYKDDANNPDPGFGNTPAKCKQFGFSTIDAIAAIADDLGA
jgi:murein tripeptide amidase MpaA